MTGANYTRERAKRLYARTVTSVELFETRQPGLAPFKFGEKLGHCRECGAAFNAVHDDGSGWLRFHEGWRSVEKGAPPMKTLKGKKREMRVMARKTKRKARTLRLTASQSKQRRKHVDGIIDHAALDARAHRLSDRDRYNMLAANAPLTKADMDRFSRIFHERLVRLESEARAAPAPTPVPLEMVEHRELTQVIAILSTALSTLQRIVARERSRSVDEPDDDEWPDDDRD